MVKRSSVLGRLLLRPYRITEFDVVHPEGLVAITAVMGHASGWALGLLRLGNVKRRRAEAVKRSS